MVQNNQELRCKYWATRSSICPLARIGHSFACSALIASLMHSAALIHLLARSLILSRSREKVYDLISQNQTVLNRSIGVLTLANIICLCRFCLSFAFVSILAAVTYVIGNSRRGLPGFVYHPKTRGAFNLIPKT